MRDHELYSKILGIEAPWSVTEVRLDMPGKTVEVSLAHGGGQPLECPKCGAECPGYDTREKRWRHLDTCQFRTVLVATLPRVECPGHGVRLVQVPWSEPGSRFTALYEALVIDWCKEASISGVARLLGLSWVQVDGIMARAVRRGLERRKTRLPSGICVDEKSFKKRHKYSTIVSDQETGNVLYVAEGRGKDSLEGFYEQFSEEEKAAVESVSMDMWAAYIVPTFAHIPDAERKIAFDKFHVAKHLGEAVDKVRRGEHKELQKMGDSELTGTRFLWLQNPDNMDYARWEKLEHLKDSALKTARAWAIKELASQLWYYKGRRWALKVWNNWYGWAIRSRLEPIKKAARMVKNHLYGIINAVVKNITNAGAEGINSVIQWIKYTARGFRNRERFHNAIYFHLGGLDLYPRGTR